jgi:SAM-dependent methyltransferase
MARAIAALHPVAERVQAFYEANPFPGYDLDKYQGRDDLRERASPYARLLDSQVPYRATVVDVGCGTGQLACFLGLRPRSVLGVDFSEGSLARARQLKERLALDNVSFAPADVLDLALPDASYDYVFCNGVLHHTPEPKRGFAHLARIARPGGYVTVGLYNRYGRFVHRTLSRASTRLGRAGEALADWGVRHMLGDQHEALDADKKQSWLADQFYHPHESVHTAGEVLGWFREFGLDYVSSLPPIEPLRDEAHVNLFARHGHAPDTLARQLGALVCQLQWIYRLRWTGGYFLLVARKPAPEHSS